MKRVQHGVAVEVSGPQPQGRMGENEVWPEGGGLAPHCSRLHEGLEISLSRVGYLTGQA